MDKNIGRQQKTLLLSLVGVLTMITAIAGATFAFFQVTATVDDKISGTAATIDFDLAVNLSSAAATENGKMVPQLDSAIQSAVTGTTNGSCVDGNGNTVCKVYTITITNNSTSTVSLTGELVLTAATIPNLKWTTGTSATAGFTGAKTKADTDLSSAFTLAPTNSKTFYVAIWISEIGSAQTDSGSFSGTVTFKSTTGEGVTSTITS